MRDKREGGSTVGLAVTNKSTPARSIRGGAGIGAAVVATLMAGLMGAWIAADTACTEETARAKRAAAGG